MRYLDTGGIVGWGAGGEGEVFELVGDGEGAELVAFLKDFVASEEVDGQRDDDANPVCCQCMCSARNCEAVPCGAVADCYTHEGPFATNPAPELVSGVNLTGTYQLGLGSYRSWAVYFPS